jgi:hypothetical protein
MNSFYLEIPVKTHENVVVYQDIIQQPHTKVWILFISFAEVYITVFLTELEEKDDDAHLKCPEDTTSIGSNSVCCCFSCSLVLLL